MLVVVVRVGVVVIVAKSFRSKDLRVGVGRVVLLVVAA